MFTAGAVKIMSVLFLFKTEISLNSLEEAEAAVQELKEGTVRPAVFVTQLQLPAHVILLAGL